MCMMYDYGGPNMRQSTSTNTRMSTDHGARITEGWGTVMKKRNGFLFLYHIFTIPCSHWVDRGTGGWTECPCNGCSGRRCARIFLGFIYWSMEFTTATTTTSKTDFTRGETVEGIGGGI